MTRHHDNDNEISPQRKRTVSVISGEANWGFGDWLLAAISLFMFVLLVIAWAIQP